MTIIWLLLTHRLKQYLVRAWVLPFIQFLLHLGNSLVAFLDGLNTLHLLRKSQFCHDLWVQCGRSKTGVVSDIMRRTRADYHRAIRQVKRNEQAIINKRFAASLLHNSSRDFWSKAKRIRRNNVCFSNCVDSYSNPADIANTFAEKYQELYTSVAYKANDMEHLRNRVANMISTVGFSDYCKVSCEEVVFAVCKLKGW